MFIRNVYNDFYGYFHLLDKYNINITLLKIEKINIFVKFLKFWFLSEHKRIDNIEIILYCMKMHSNNIHTIDWAVSFNV